MQWKAGLLNLRNALYQGKKPKLNTQSDSIKAKLYIYLIISTFYTSYCIFLSHATPYVMNSQN